MDKILSKSGIERIRLQAESLYKKRKIDDKIILSEFEMLKLIHELEVHQIELEMQADELQQATKQAAVATERYIELYDFAPSVFVTISLTWKIEKITLRGAQMLGKKRAELFYYTFDYFVSPDSKSIFKDFMARLLESKTHHTCNVVISAIGIPSIFVQIDAILAENGKEFYMSITDVSKFSSMEQDLLLVNQELENLKAKIEQHKFA